MPKKKRKNPLAKSPLLKKGGVHERSKSAERTKKKRELKRELKDK